MALNNKKLVIKRLLNKGNRGIVYLGIYNNKQCAVKIKNPDSTAIGRIKNEGTWLQKLNKKKIGPKIYFFDDEKIIMDYIEGEHLNQFLEICKDNSKIKKILLDILRQCRILDKLMVNKYEMQRITKNVIVRKDMKPVLIDFERCKKVEIPKNVTQFCTFLFKMGLFDFKNQDILKKLRSYKANQDDKNFNALVNALFS